MLGLLGREVITDLQLSLAALNNLSLDFCCHSSVLDPDSHNFRTQLSSLKMNHSQAKDKDFLC